MVVIRFSEVSVDLQYTTRRHITEGSQSSVFKQTEKSLLCRWTQTFSPSLRYPYKCFVHAFVYAVFSHIHGFNCHEEFQFSIHCHGGSCRSCAVSCILHHFDCHAISRSSSAFSAHLVPFPIYAFFIYAAIFRKPNLAQNQSYLYHFTRNAFHFVQYWSPYCVMMVYHYI
jgi:hypothetical protein